MKKKHRTITVNEKVYGWTIYGGGKEHDVTIWYDKKELFTITLRESSVTPSLIRELIETYKFNSVKNENN